MDAMFAALLKRFPSNEFALMQEVSDDAGFNRSRSADFIAVGLWPSRGLPIHVIEKKVSRYDWLKELKNPKKQENHIKYCDYMWLYTETEDIAKIEEIPVNWGWITIKGGKIKTIKEAPKLNPEQVSRGFLCAMLKRAVDKTGYVHTSSLDDYKKDLEDQWKKIAQEAGDYAVRELKDLQKKVYEFERISGVHIERQWDLGNVAEAVRFIKNGGIDASKKNLESLQEKALKIADEISKILLLPGEEKTTQQ